MILALFGSNTKYQTYLILTTAIDTEHLQSAIINHCLKHVAQVNSEPKQTRAGGAVIIPFSR